ncbi:hypothetical protein NIES4103_63440 [Nostoc sp. NIES-4103]|nr:hypothetical protein NIES4103_63440 [Nostoc sp. NIES-4103]
MSLAIIGKRASIFGDKRIYLGNGELDFTIIHHISPITHYPCPAFIKLSHRKSFTKSTSNRFNYECQN